MDLALPVDKAPKAKSKYSLLVVRGSGFSTTGRQKDKIKIFTISSGFNTNCRQTSRDKIKRITTDSGWIHPLPIDKLPKVKQDMHYR